MRWNELSQAGPDLATQLAPYSATVRTWLLAISAGFAGALFELLLSLALAFFLYRDGPACGALLTSVGERLSGTRAHRLIAVAGSTIRNVVVGLIGTNLVQATLGGIGFWAAGVPGAFLLGFAVFFLTIVPSGPIFVWVPAVVWLLNAGKTTEAILLGVWCILIFQVLETVLRLYFAGRGSTLPAVLVLLGMLGGLTAFGFLGLFLGPTLLAIAYTLIEEWRTPTEPDVGPLPSRS
jgi:predicted PurR-regulated permease PerM